jgi:hypothetical protein
MKADLRDQAIPLKGDKVSFSLTDPEDLGILVQASSSHRGSGLL